MKTVVIRECEVAEIPDAYTFDLPQEPIHHCIGCWACWWKTPGICAFTDLNEFYHEYITADRAIYFAKVSRGFVSNNLKTLFDRMIPLYLPYVRYETGESMHTPRYEKYPGIEFYYEGNFETPDGRDIFEDYVKRVFYQFHSQLITVKPIEEFSAKVGSIA